MSENIFKFACIEQQAGTLSALHAALLTVVDNGSLKEYPALLTDLFSEWDQPAVERVELFEGVLSFSVQTGSFDNVEKEHVMALHAAGATSVRIEAWYGQQGERRTLYYQNGKKVAAKAFPPIAPSEESLVRTLLEKGKDKQLVEKLDAGLDPNLRVDGRPLLLCAFSARLEKTALMLLAKGVAATRDPVDAPEIAFYLIDRYASPQRERLLADLLAHGAAPDLIFSRQYVAEALLEHPEALAWFLEHGVDANVMLYDYEGDELIPVGSPLFHFEKERGNYPESIAILTARGARAIAPPFLTPRTRLTRLLTNHPEAESVAQLVADGISMDQETDRGPAMLYALRERFPIAVAMLRHGAPAAAWLEPEMFEREVLRNMLMHFDDPDSILEFMRHLLDAGLEPDRILSLELSAGGSWIPYVKFRGPLFLFVIVLLCSSPPADRALCLQLAQMLVERAPQVGISDCDLASTEREGWRGLPVKRWDGVAMLRQLMMGGNALHRLQHASNQASDPAYQTLMEAVARLDPVAIGPSDPQWFVEVNPALKQAFANARES